MSSGLSAASAAELARAAFRRLAALRLPPTPQNYSRVWAELEHAGLAQAPGEPAAPGAPQASAVAEDAAAAPWRQLWEQAVQLALQPPAAAPALRQRAAQLLAAAHAPQATAQLQAVLAGNRQLWQDWRRLRAEEQLAVDRMLELFAAIVGHLDQVFGGEAGGAAEFVELRQAGARPLDAARIEAARSLIEPWLRRQAALQRGALDARSTSREVVGQVLRSLDSFLGENRAFTTSLQGDLHRLQGGLEGEQLAQLAQALLRRGTELHRSSEDFATRLEQAQQQAEQALQRIQSLESELQAASRQLLEDPLTGALNRRGLDAAFARDSAQAAQATRSFSVALLDLDHFKRVNDSYGHDFGDEALRGLVQVARKLVRPGDSIARMGGEEFMVLFPDSDAVSAQRAVERLLQGFRNRRMLVRSTGQRVELSFSAGVAEFQPGEDFSCLYRRADTALRQAKEGGRQRVCVAPAQQALADVAGDA